MSDDTLYQLYCAPTETGEKLWAIGAAPVGLRIRFGAVGKPSQLREIPVPAGSVRSEMDTRIDAKLGEGYVFQGEGTFDGREVKPVSKGSSGEVLWSVEQSIELQGLSEHLRVVAQQFRESSVRYDEQSQVLCIGKAFKLGLHHGFTAAGRGGGQIGNDHGVLERLAVLKLTKLYTPSIQWTVNGEIVVPALKRDDPVFGLHVLEQQRVLEYGCRLGLCLPRISLASLPAERIGFSF